MKQTTANLILRERRFKTGFFIILHLIALSVLIYLPDIMIATVLSFVIYYLMEPMVIKLEERGLSRTQASSIPFLLFGLAVFIITLWIVPLLSDQIEALKAQMPAYLTKLKELATQWESKAHPLLKELGQSSVVESTQQYLLTMASNFFSKIPTLLTSSITVLLLTPFFAFFLLYEGAELYRRFLKIVPNHLFELMVTVNHSINVQMGQFIRARLLETALISLFVYVGLNLVNFPYSLIFSITTGLLNLIPYVGPVIAALPQIILCLISPELRHDIIPIILINLGSQIFDAVILVPLLVAKIVDLHPVIVVLAVILGGQTLGVLGMIIFIPLASAIKVFVTAFYKYMTHSN